MKKILIVLATSIMLMPGCKNIETENSINEISPYLFGQNLWLTDGAEGRKGYIEEALWPKVKESGAKIIRIGGNGYDQKLPDLFTLEKWVRSIKSIGAEPLMQVSKYESAEKSAELVRYFNKEKDLHIKFWCIGNEPYQIHKWPIDSISKLIKTHSTAMKAIDPSIKIFAPDAAAYYNELYEAILLNDRLSVAGRDENGNWYIDGLTFHNYPNSKNYSRSDVIFYSVSKMRGMMLSLVEDINAANKKYQRFGEDKLLWGLTEFNITYNNPDYMGTDGIAVPSFINGQFWAEVFAMAMEYGAFCVTPWCIQESDRASTYFGYIGGPPDFIPHSTFYHMKMMAENMKGSYLKVSTNNPYVKAFGSESVNLTTLILMNQSDHDSIQIDLDKQEGENVTTKNLIIKFSKNLSLKYNGILEPHSTITLVFDKKGKITKELLYTLEMAENNEPPQLQ